MREKYVVAAEQLHLQKGLDHEFEKPDIVPGFFFASRPQFLRLEGGVATDVDGVVGWKG